MSKIWFSNENNIHSAKSKITAMSIYSVAAFILK